MNILIAADYATPASGNFVASLVELGRLLKREGSTLTLIFPENHNTTSEDSWVNWLKSEGHTVYLASREQTEEEQLSLLRSVIGAHNIDILHIHFGMFHHAVMSHTKELGVKILVHDHMDFPAGANMKKQRLRCAAQSLRYRLLGVAIASVNPEKDSAYFLAKHWYAPNGLSLERNVTHSATRDEVRAELGLAADESMCLFLGWDLYRKGLDIAINAVAEIRKSYPKMLLGVVGVGNPPSEACRRFIKEHTDIDPNSDWIRYLNSREDMFAYHRGVDVYLSASRSEAFSYGILESISQNTPVAVSDIKGTSWCHSYSKAAIYSVESVTECAQAILHALEMGRAESNANDIVSAYSIEKWCNRVNEIYYNLLNN